MEERLQKILARAGLGSRRACEIPIRQGRVMVNGEVAQLGQKADPNRDSITVDGKPIHVSREDVYVALHKPVGVLSDQGDRSRRFGTVRDLVPVPGHLFPVGRLDLLSEGLVLLTSDGELAHLLTHPRFEHTKEYHAFVQGQPSELTLTKWREGVVLDGRRTAPASVSVMRREGDRCWLRVVLREGRKRQIRRVAASLGHMVDRLIRVRIGPVHLADLKPGEWRKLSDRELALIGELKKHQQTAKSGSQRRSKRRGSRIEGGVAGRRKRR